MRAKYTSAALARDHRNARIELDAIVTAVAVDRIFGSCRHETAIDPRGLLGAAAAKLRPVDREQLERRSRATVTTRPVCRGLIHYAARQLPDVVALPRVAKEPGFDGTRAPPIFSLTGCGHWKSSLS